MKILPQACIRIRLCLCAKGVESTKEIRSFEVAEIQLSYKSKVKTSLRPKISSSKEAYEILMSNWDESKIDFVEQFKVILLNRANKVLGIYEVSTGGVSGTVADPKLVFGAALKANSSSILLCTNKTKEESKGRQGNPGMTRPGPSGF